jgi:dienelactone hydrolase
MHADAGRHDAATLEIDAAVPDAPGEDAFVAADAPALDAALGSRCDVTATSVTCAHETTMLATTTTTPDRAVHYQVPLGAPPAAGFPVVIAFQGTSLPSEMTWSGHTSDAYGLYYQALVVARLLDAGYAVITPDVAGAGTTYWDTNIPPYATAWSTAPDHQLMLHLLAAIDAGDFGALDGASLYATGFSSGGYMTSRMAVSYMGRFRALAIASGSYATCGGSACVVPATLPADHPPTLFLHGSLDTFVPLSTMMAYESRLHGQGIATRVVTEAAAGHQWIAAAPDEVLAWFQAR